MNRLPLALLVALAVCPPLSLAQDANRIRAHVKFLSSDLVEGRGVGQRGGDLATEYIATQFALAGLKPAGDSGTFFQKVPLIGVETQPSAELSFGGENLRWTEDFVGVSPKQQQQTSFDAEAVFVGHGIVAPEFDWDDYQDADVKGKVVVLFTNEPTSNDPKFFGGRALTYYGRWTYKYEQALRRGAAAVLIVHTTPTAGYGWDVVRSSWSREDPEVKLAPNQAALAFQGWVTPAVGAKLLASTGKNLDELLKACETRDFRPIPLGLRVRGTIPSKVRSMDTRNVAGIVYGSDPKLKSEAVVFSAHWDHLGVGNPVNGDSIYNGAVDNATGCGILLELARVWSELPQKPRRSAIFVSVTAEEGGLRGSEYFGEHPFVPAGKIALGLNYDGLQPLGKTKDVEVGGAERTSVWPTLQAIAKRMNLEIAPDAHPEQGHYYRSDHFSFARVGVPSFSINEGNQFLGKPANFGEKAFEEYNEKRYHQPSDEFQESWDFSGLERVARFGFLIATEVANQQAMPTWRAGDEFLAARERSWK